MASCKKELIQPKYEYVLSLSGPEAKHLVSLLGRTTNDVHLPHDDEKFEHSLAIFESLRDAGLPRVSGPRLVLKNGFPLRNG